MFRKIGILVMIITALVTLGCSNGNLVVIDKGAETDVLAVEEKFGSLSLDLIANISRTGMTPNSYYVKATRDGYATVDQTVDTTSANLTLQIGTWLIEVTAKNASGLEVYYGYKSVTVVEGANSATIGLSAKTGAAKLPMSWGVAGFVTKMKATAARTGFTNRTVTVEIASTETSGTVYLFDLLEGNWNVTLQGLDSSNDVYYSKTLSAQTIVNSQLLSVASTSLDEKKVLDVAFSPAGGNYSSDQTVTLSTQTVGASIKYTTNGSDPIASGTVYSAPFSVSGNGTHTIKAYAYKSGLSNSRVTTSVYNITYGSMTVNITPAAGTYNVNKTVTITCSEGGATIYYTTNGDDPTGSSSVYTAPFTVTKGTTTVKAFARKSGFNDTSIVSRTYVIDYPDCATPTFSPNGGTYNSAQTVTISSTAGSTIYYTTNGDTPTTSSLSITSGGTISLSTDGNYTIKAFAVKAGYDDSSVATSSQYVIAIAKTVGVNFAKLAKNVVISAGFQTVSFSNESEKWLAFQGEEGKMIYLEWADNGTLGTTANVKVTLYENDTTTVSNSINAVDVGYGTDRKALTLGNARYFIKVTSSTGAAITGNCLLRVGYKTVFKYHTDVGSGNSVYIVGDTLPLRWDVGHEASWTDGNVWVCEIYDLDQSFEFKATKGPANQTNGNIWESGADNHSHTPGYEWVQNPVVWQ
ncbi:MAG TPA: chitobiase/beta-hexosaminidase C-terminal domain-containing protein [Spirochaetota bacterium]|mgnify:CR=1 FL=1|nr:chitobiase/beta-hexosaminidase C-terminal domain-containing protein [Spirochaetota bacterium]HOS32651.1 chitobiase/beta-hexosaminidase C-terminal domain-containing protein [Spirochaetota bacterium]HOS54722.1 chitobiase/beta-hexosaminidase C-terminal domain-containing protein [Spirochaetota bacterium]HQF76600.1 chitobiase/beta-hexosaminidase C-terminal domain-containing protein [Spirochaetota bacterium]